uniref:Uncharacterized protein n=1 Tax=Triticum urartu TaxID=4572 RepID=A0A8R7PRJ2_TRIUA
RPPPRPLTLSSPTIAAPLPPLASTVASSTQTTAAVAPQPLQSGAAEHQLTRSIPSPSQSTDDLPPPLYTVVPQLPPSSRASSPKLALRTCSPEPQGAPPASCTFSTVYAFTRL